MPSTMDLVIIEPLVFTENVEHLKHALCYPISISVSPVPPALYDGAPPPLLPPKKDHDDCGGPSHHRW
jgi:hypothetical protein